MDEPGGGKRVRVTEPNGYQIEVVWGMDKVPEIPAPRQLLNSGYAPLARKGDLMRIQKGPSRVKRIAHAVLGTPKVKGDGRLVPPPSRLHLLGRRLCRREGEPDRPFNRIDQAKPSSTIMCSSRSTTATPA